MIKVDGKIYYPDVVTWPATDFDYTSTDDISTDVTVSVNVGAVTGTAHFKAKISEGGSVWNMTFYYYGTSSMLLTKSK